MYITLETTITDRGIVCEHAVLGRVAIIERKIIDGQPFGWYVMPYAFEPYIRASTFNSLRAAEHYAVALAYEMHELGKNASNVFQPKNV